MEVIFSLFLYTCNIDFTKTLYPLGNIHQRNGVIFNTHTDVTATNLFQFTLTCISTGGPATTVTWTRDSVTVTEGTETVLDDPVTAQYTHTLTVTERLGGLYKCRVGNSKPSEAYSSLFVEGIVIHYLHVKVC